MLFPLGSGAGRTASFPRTRPLPARMTWNRRLEIGHDLLAVAIAVWASYWFATSFGYNFALDNHTTYLLGALRLYDPSLLKNDWVAAQCTSYHPAFSYVGWALLALDPTGWSFAYANVAVLTAMGLAIYWLCRLLGGRGLGLPAFLVVLAINMQTRTHSVQVSYIADFIFQPSTLGALGWLGAFACFVRRRWLLTGICLAVGGLFHANYLLLGFPVFGLALLLAGPLPPLRTLVGRGVYVLGPSLVSFALLSPVIFAAATDPNAEAARQIFFEIRSPHHYVPHIDRFQRFAGWQLLGVGAMLPLLRGRADRGTRFGALLAGLAVLVWVGTVLTTWVDIPRVAQLFVWRAAPYVALCCQVGVAVSALRLVVRPERIREYSVAAVPLVAAGLGVLLATAKSDKQESVADVLVLTTAATAIGMGITFALETLVRRTAPRGAPLGTLGSPVVRLIAWALIPLSVVFWLDSTAGQRETATIASRSSLLKGFDKSEEDLYSWIRDHTSRDARFLQPPLMERFRLQSQRAVVVDWKSPPILPSELLEWYERLGAISGRSNPRGPSDVDSGYRSLDAARVEQLRSRYGIDYVVVTRGSERALAKYPRVYRNGRYAVFDVRPPQ